MSINIKIMMMSSINTAWGIETCACVVRVYVGDYDDMEWYLWTKPTKRQLRKFVKKAKYVCNKYPRMK